jgi:hypothetical protein
MPRSESRPSTSRKLRENRVEPDRVLDDGRREVTVPVADRLHSQSLAESSPWSPETCDKAVSHRWQPRCVARRRGNTRRTKRGRASGDRRRSGPRRAAYGKSPISPRMSLWDTRARAKWLVRVGPSTGCRRQAIPTRDASVERVVIRLRHLAGVPRPSQRSATFSRHPMFRRVHAYDRRLLHGRRLSSSIPLLTESTSNRIFRR